VVRGVLEKLLNVLKAIEATKANEGFEVSEKAIEKLKEVLARRKNSSPIRILLVEAA
jgi:hypothetical protein